VLAGVAAATHDTVGGALGEPAVDRADKGNTVVGRQAESLHRDDRHDEGDERAGQTSAHPLEGDDHGQDAERDQQ